MSLESAIAALRREMTALGLSSLTVEAPTENVSAAVAPPVRVWSKTMSGTDESVGDVIIRVMAHGELMTMSHIHAAVSAELPVIPANGTVRAVVWSMQQAGLVVKGNTKAPGVTGRRSTTYRLVSPD